MPRAELYDGTILDFEEGTPDDVIARVARQQTEKLRTAEARQPLPPGVTPSTAGGGRGLVQPPAEPPPEQTAPAPAPAAEQAQPAQPWRIGGRGTAPVKAPPAPVDPMTAALNAPAETGAGGYTAAQIEEGTIAPDRLERIRQERTWAARGIPEAHPMPWAQEKAAQIRDYTKNPIARGAIAGFSGLGQVGVGATRLAADLVGADSVADFAAATSRTAGDIGGGMTQDLRGNDKLVADVTASIMQSAPSLAVGTVGGPALSTLFTQTALAEYNEGRNSGFDVGASLARGGIMGMAEAVGERFGFPQQIKLLRGVVRDMPPNELAKTLGELIKKEIPGEQLTTALQFMADKLGPAAQNPNATLSDYLEQAGETLKTTVAQTAVMGGGPAVLAQGRINDAAVGRSALTQAERLAMDKWGANPYAIANARGFRVEPPLVSDDAKSQRSKTTAIFENAAASYGIPSTAVARAKKAAEGLSLEQLGPFYSRFVQALQKRNLVGSDVDTHVLDSLEAGPVVLPEERAAQVGETKPAAAETKPAKPETAPVEQDYSGLSEPSTVAEPAAQPATEPAAAGIDEAAHAAATSPQNDLQEPTPAQQEAGNYQKGHHRIGGLDVSIENPQGSVRRSKPDAPVKWETEMQHHYGYIRGTVGQDGDHIDTFIKPGTPDDFAGNVFVVDQVDPKTGKPDEHKVMLGFDTEAEARAAYLSNYEKGWKGLGAITAAPMADFKTWLSGDTSKPFAESTRARGPGFVNGPQTTEPRKATVQTKAGMKLELRRDGIGSYIITNQDGKRIGAFSYTVDGSGRYRVNGIEVHPDMQRQGVATAVYDFLEADGKPLVPSGSQSEAGRMFWENRRGGAEKTVTGQVAGTRTIGRVGDMPNQAEPLELRANADGTVTPWLEGHELVDFESGAPLRLPGSTSDAQAVAAIKAAGAVGRSKKFFGVAQDAAPAQVMAKRPGRSRALDPATDTMLQALAKLGGVQRQAMASEFGLRPEELRHSVTVAGLKGYPFRAKGGMGVDTAIEALREAGYLVGVSDKDARHAFEDAVHRELGGGQALTPQGQVARAAAEYEAQAANAQELDAAAQVERDAIMAEAGLSEAEMAAVTDDDIDLAGTSNTSPEAFMRAMGFTEEEIARETGARAPAGAQEAGAPASQETGAAAGARSQEARPAPAGATEEGLTAPTATGLRQAAERRRRAEQSARDKERAAAEKAKADAERGEFTLTGSDRPADVAAAAGQAGLFEAPAPVPANTTQPPAKKLTKAAQAQADADQRLANYFRPGNVVRNSRGGFDEVLAFTPASAQRNWSVTVQEVKEVDNQWVRQGKPQDARQHSTMPEERLFKNGPFRKLGPQPGSEVTYSEPRADGAPFANAPDRGQPAAAATPAPAAEPSSPPADSEAFAERQRAFREAMAAYWDNTGFPAVQAYVRAYDGFGAERLERHGIKPKGLSARQWLETFLAKQSTWDGSRKVEQTGIQSLSTKNLWPTDDGAGERLRKAMLEAVRAIKNAPGTNDEVLAKAFFEPKAAPSPAKPKPEVSKNTIFTEDAAARARAVLKSKIGTLRAGLDPEEFAAGVTLAGYHIERGARTFAAYAKAMIDDMGEAVRPYLKSWYAALYYDPRAADMQPEMTPPAKLDEAAAAAEEQGNVRNTDTGVEPDRGDAAGVQRDVEETLSGRGLGEGPQTAGKRTGSARRGRPDNAGVPTGRASPLRELGDQPVHRAGGPAEPSLFDAGVGDGARGDNPGIAGVQPDPRAAGPAPRPAVAWAGIAEKRAAQRAAEGVKQEPGLDNIRATLPYLQPGQQEDVFKAETRFSKPDGYGMLFTNGTGTGKTFSGLGIVKRFVRAGKGEVLIVVPDVKIMADWIESGTALGLNIKALEDTKDAGRGVTITTYANLGDNDALATRSWDLVVPDEVHMLMQSADGKPTKALNALRAITLHPRGVSDRFEMLNRDDVNTLKDLAKRISDLEESQLGADAAKRQKIEAQIKVLEDRLGPLRKKLDTELGRVREDVLSRQGEKRTRLAALSATPFAYEKTVDWADGYLFDYAPAGAEEQASPGYNEGDARDQFFIQHFGYRMRYNRLTEPDAKVDRGLMQRQFNGWLKNQGVLSGRMLDVDADYDRRFILVESAVGNEIDRAIEWIRDKAKESRQAKKDNPDAIDGWTHIEDELNEELFGKLGHLVRRYLLEAIKAKEVIQHVRDHMAIGRKVVVFHDFKKGGSRNPFAFAQIDAPRQRPEHMDEEAFDKYKAVLDARNAAAAEFRAAFPSLAGDRLLAELVSPIIRFKREFPDVLLINGDEKKADLLARYKRFNDDDVGPQVALVQSAKNKGWSGHDTTGKHQRVLFNLGLPTQPTMSIQQEGRIYRTGQVSNAIFRYLNTGTNWERWAFAQTIAERASAAENLATGELARALKDAFIAGFEESGDFPAGHEGEGTGGKERDRLANEAVTEYDRAKAFYFGTAKKTAKTKAKEGVDYFATPEPVGLKMVQMLDLRGGEDALEPSAGHGAIARWFPETANRTAVEPSNTLGSRLAMVFDGKIIRGDFEDLNVVNKYDGIAMNPPFGTAGRTAIDHLAKAAEQHLREGGRIVALIPTGPAADKKFDKWFYEGDTRKAAPLGNTQRAGDFYTGDMVQLDGHPNERFRVMGRAENGGVRLRAAGMTSAAGDVVYRSHYVERVVAAGPRTETYHPAAGLHLVADIKLPSVTFERAGTQVMTRIVVIEKTKKDEQPPQQISRDYSSIQDINELFDRMEDLELKPRAGVDTGEEAQAQAAPAPAPRSVAKAEKAAAAQQGEALAAATGVVLVEHTTGKGKLLKGVIRKDLTLAEAKQVDEYTFKKDGGFFIRAEHLAKLAEKYPDAQLDLGREAAAAVAGGQASAADVEAVAELERKLAGGKERRFTLTALPAITRVEKGASAAEQNRFAAVAMMRALFKKRVVLFSSQGGGGANINGVALASRPDVLFLNAGTRRPVMSVLGHELLHQMRRDNQALYDRLAERLDALIKDPGEHFREISARYATAGITAPSPQKIREELVADIVGDNFTDPAFWRGLQEGRPGLFQRVLGAVRDFLNSVLERLRNERPYGTDRYLSDVVAARDAVVQAMKDYAGSQDADRSKAAATTYEGTSLSVGDGHDYPVAGPTVDGRTVRDRIPNQDSIRASVTNPRILAGVREVPISAFDPEYVQGVRDRALDARTQRLADEIEESAEINPLIVAIDSEGPYILEGGHRFDALIKLGAKSLPALVVVDQDAVHGGEISLSVDRHTPEQRAALARAGIDTRSRWRRAGDKIREFYGRSVEAWKDNWGRQFQQGYLDQFTGIAQAVERELGGLPVDQDPYVAARLANGGASSVMRGLLLHGQAAWADNGQHLVKIPDTRGLLDILAPLGDDLNDFFGWMIGNRAARLAKEGRERNLKPEQIQTLQDLAKGKESKFRAAALEYAAFKRSVLDIAEQAGLIDGEARKVWDNADYIPFYRKIDQEAVFSPTGRKGLAGQSSGIRTLRGGEAALNDPMENIIMNFSRLIDASLKNRAIAKTVHLLEQAGSDVVTREGMTFSKELVPAGQVKKVLRDAGTPDVVMDIIPDTAFAGMAKMWAMQPPADPDIVRVMVDGHPRYYRVNDPLLLKALTSFVPFDFPGLGVLRAFKRILTAGVTAAPPFWIRNFVRDTVAAQLVGRDGFFPGKSVSGIVKSYTETGAGEAMLFAGASFQSGQVNAGDPAGTGAAIRRALRRRGFNAATVEGFMGTVIDTPARWWEHYRQVGEAVENSNREAVYEAAAKAGKGGTAAAYEAKDLMDFTLRGSSPVYQFMADVLPFFNARVQGMYRLGRASPKRLAAYGMLMMVASLALAWANADNPEYEELPDWDKDNYWHFWIRGEHFRLPKPFELGVAFATVPERIMRYIRGQDTGKKAATRIAHDIIDQFAFDPVPQAIRPALNVAMNRDTFRDRPIESQSDANKLPAQRYSALTSPAAVKLAQAAEPLVNATGLGPKKLEYLANAYFGTIGAYALGLADLAVAALDDKAPAPAKRLDDLPLVREFYRMDPPRATVFQQDLYALRADIEAIYATVQDKAKKGDKEGAVALAKREATKLALRQQVKSATDLLQDLNRRRDAIYKDTRMTPEKKREEIDKILAQQALISRKLMNNPVVRSTQ